MENVPFAVVRRVAIVLKVTEFGRRRWMLTVWLRWQPATFANASMRPLSVTR